jgi:phosphoribosyl-ATP pyrophosphohydrolase
MSNADSIVSRLAAVIESRRSERPPGSYTVQLLEAGHTAISAKIIEEAYELVSAAAEEDRAGVSHEAADVVYHVLVLLTACDVPWTDVERELSQRFGVSGLAEKANRAEESQ